MPAPRRTLRFATLHDIVAEADRLADQPHRPLGNWTLAQNVWHVARFMQASREGFGFALPAPVRLLARLLLKKRSLTRLIPPGFKPPAAGRALLPPGDVRLDEAMAFLREQVARASRPGSMTQPSPLFGRLTHDEWVQLHLRHAELHLSFIAPEPARDGHQDQAA